MNGTKVIKNDKLYEYTTLPLKAKYNRTHVVPGPDRTYIVFAGEKSNGDTTECVVHGKLTDLDIHVLQLVLGIGPSTLTRKRHLLYIMMLRPLLKPAQLAELVHTSVDLLCEVLNIKFDYRDCVASNAYAISMLKNVDSVLVNKALTMSPTEFVPICQAQLKSEREAARNAFKSKRR